MQRDRRALCKILPIFTVFPPHTMGCCDRARPKDPFHLVADCTLRRRLQDLRQAVSRELAAPYSVKYLPDTGQTVLTPDTRFTWTVQPDPSMEDKSIVVVWRIRSLHLSRTEARYLVGSMTYGVVWEQVYSML